MTETYAGGHQETAAGKYIVMVVSLLCTVLVIAGLIYASGTGARQQAALLAAGCEPGLSSTTAVCTTQPMLAQEYLGILTPAARQLQVDVAVFAANKGSDLAAAEAALTAEATTEREFTANLATVKFPPAITPMAQALIGAGDAYANVLTEQAQSSSLAQLRSFSRRVQAADAPVQAELGLIAKAVAAPVQAG